MQKNTHTHYIGLTKQKPIEKPTAKPEILLVRHGTHEIVLVDTYGLYHLHGPLKLRLDPRLPCNLLRHGKL